MIKSGLNVPTPEIPMPDFAVPNAAPMQPKIIAAAMPACHTPKYVSLWLRYDIMLL
jgi:hypothetical protein